MVIVPEAIGITPWFTFRNDIAIKSDGGVSITPGGTVTYALAYANQGNQDATGVVITESVPLNTSFDPGASTPGWACAPTIGAGSVCTLAIGGLAGGATGNATFAVTVSNPLPAGVTQIANTATIGDESSNGADPTPGNNSSSDTTPVSAAPDLRLVKRAAPRGEEGKDEVPGGGRCENAARRQPCSLAPMWERGWPASGCAKRKTCSRKGRGMRVARAAHDGESGCGHGRCPPLNRVWGAGGSKRSGRVGRCGMMHGASSPEGDAAQIVRMIELDVGARRTVQ
jgi:uncharacterized repeat protein (TIGR01451 family)